MSAPTRHTIKIDGLRALVIEPVGGTVAITLTTAGIRMFTQAITLEQAQALTVALQLSLESAGQAA